MSEKVSSERELGDRSYRLNYAPCIIKEMRGYDGILVKDQNDHSLTCGIREMVPPPPEFQSEYRGKTF